MNTSILRGHLWRRKTRRASSCADSFNVICSGLLLPVQPISDAPSAGLVAGQAIKRDFTNVWKNEAGTWRLFVRHANVIPGP
jgi:hypothetical protein